MRFEIVGERINVFDANNETILIPKGQTSLVLVLLIILYHLDKKRTLSAYELCDALICLSDTQVQPRYV